MIICGKALNYIKKVYIAETLLSNKQSENIRLSQSINFYEANKLKENVENDILKSNNNIVEEDNERRRSLTGAGHLLECLQDLVWDSKLKSKLNSSKKEDYNIRFKNSIKFILRLEDQKTNLIEKRNALKAQHPENTAESNVMQTEKSISQATDFWQELKLEGKCADIELEIDQDLYSSFLVIAFAREHLKSAKSSHDIDCIMSQIANLITSESDANVNPEVDKLKKKAISLHNSDARTDVMLGVQALLIMDLKGQSRSCPGARRGPNYEVRPGWARELVKGRAEDYLEKLEPKMQIRIFNGVVEHIIESKDRVTELENEIAKLED